MDRTQTLHWALRCLMGSLHGHGSFYVSRMVAGIITEIQAELSHEEETKSSRRVLGTRPGGGGRYGSPWAERRTSVGDGWSCKDVFF